MRKSKFVNERDDPGTPCYTTEENGGVNQPRDCDYRYSPTSPSYRPEPSYKDPEKDSGVKNHHEYRPTSPGYSDLEENSDAKSHLRYKSTSRIREGPKNKSIVKIRYHPYHRDKNAVTLQDRYRMQYPQFPNRDQNNYLHFSFTRLTKLSKMTSDDCVAELEGKNDQFEQLLNNDFRPDLMVVTVRVLANICQTNFTEILTSLLSCACSATFLKSLESYLAKLPFENDGDKLNNKLYREDIDSFWSKLVEIFKKITELLPIKARDELIGVLSKSRMIITTIETSQDYIIDQNVKDAILEIYNNVKEEIVKFEATDKDQATSSTPVKSDNPPEDFRSLSVIPTIQDLADNNPFIRPSKVKGAYDSVEHYLDVQYRLLREDFISPLRNGIREYLHGPKKYRNTQLRIYRKVKFLEPGRADNNFGVTVSFGIIKNIDWKYSKRFMFGGLLCLSNDNFDSILFATVANRDEKCLREGTVVIEPCNHGTVITRDSYQSNWVMLESKIYFEPYLVVLNAMRQMNLKNFPMINYLVNADTSNKLPRYLNTDPVIKYKYFELPMIENEAWPTPEELKLDESQYEAFKSALSQEFAIIQGPPGTGKTFIALEIIGALLQNKVYWRREGPIVIVCLTNHALDQFLEGILKHTSSILRVGNRSKSEALSQFTLAERRNSLSSAKKRDRSFALHRLRQKKFDIKQTLRDIEKIRLHIKHLTTENAIVPLIILRAYCDDKRLQVMNANDQLPQWLLEDNNDSMNIEEHFDEYTNISMNNDFVPTCELDPKLFFLLQNIDANIAEIQEEINNVQHAQKKRRLELYTRRFDPVRKLKDDIDALELKKLAVQHNLAQHPLLTLDQQNFNPFPRWQIYWKWVKLSYENAVCRLTKLENDYRQSFRKLEEAKQIVDLEVLDMHDIVGFTTTSAARLHASLRALHAPIVLVEEAAEILESHVVCSLTKSCQHVILIGDHKQLRPKAADYRLGTKYNLNISLFERMVNIRGNCTQLAHQHRMRPEIARLICPSIYETLHNHQSVVQYPAIMGLEKNLFFINHNNREMNHENQDSWANPYEAKFLVAFARHLILQGYKSTEITILCTYTGQIFTLNKEKNCYSILKEVRITTIDNYQGEENRIILLSLVRNNEEGNIGFLKEENRVCVALSRAREGLYIMGNMDNLIINNSVWPKIKKVLEDDNAIGDTLKLRCKFHSDNSINVQKPSDFKQCPEGGCLQKCNTDMPCGHTCPSICHTSDREHMKFTCRQRCLKYCADGHPCQLLCHLGCKRCPVTVARQLRCGHTVNIACGIDPDTFPCPVKVNVTLPVCNHTIEKACYLSVDNCRCSYPCENRLPCGHSCELTCHVGNDPDHLQYVCHKPCSKINEDCSMDHPCKLQCHEQCIPCPSFVSKKRSCGHEQYCKCCADVEQQRCFERIKHSRSCGHVSMLRCFQSNDECSELVMKSSRCGHKVQVKCCETPSSSHCKGKCKRMLKCGHPCTARCKDSCTTQCNILVPQTIPGLCGHNITVPCHLNKTVSPSKLLQYCKEPCKAELSCGHICKGNCGYCKQGRIHKPCGEKCGNILICGHRCDVPCREECPPCQKPCQIRCRHSKCSNTCGELCVPCQEPCTAGCEHTRCLKRCFDLCSRKPCEKPCSKLLKCKHPCIGFCGEPCPQLCRICNKKELMDEFFLGHEEESDARFVLLEDCKHCIENQGLLKWVSECSESIQVKTCPRCKTPIINCMRISNQIKTDSKNIRLIKKKIFGDQEKLQEQQRQLIQKLRDMILSPVPQVFDDMRKYLCNLDAKVAVVTKKQRRQSIDTRAVEAARIILNILQEIADKFQKIKSHTVRTYGFVKNQVNMLVESLPLRGQISNQEINDIHRELQRLHFIVKFHYHEDPVKQPGQSAQTEVCVMESEAELDYNTTADRTPYNSIVEKLLSIEKFTVEKEEEVENDFNELRASHHMQVMAKNERKMIVKAMGYKQGHWYKCPNGHIYSIGECGGAMQTSKCNECGAAIGGHSHRLISDNSVATEMDGATRPAWPGGI